MTLEKPVDGDPAHCGNLKTGAPNVKIAESIADNSLVFDVTTENCPCTGDWKLKYPVSLWDEISFTFSLTRKLLLVTSRISLIEVTFHTSSYRKSNFRFWSLVNKGRPLSIGNPTYFQAEASSFTYSVKSSGEYLVSFEAYFVDGTGSNSIANYSPCLGACSDTLKFTSTIIGPRSVILICWQFLWLKISRDCVAITRDISEHG